LNYKQRAVLAMRATLEAPRAGLYLGGDVKRPIRDVEVPYNENEKCHIVSLGVREKRGCRFICD
jgi:hypothetical protein